MWRSQAATRAILAAQTRLGRHIRKLREANGMSQEKLAEKAHLHPKYVSRVENGKANPTLAVLVTLAAALNARPLDLLS